MSSAKFLIGCVVLAACARDAKRNAYEEAARELNPILLALQPTRAKLDLYAPPSEEPDSSFFGSHPIAVERTIETCTDGRDLFRELGKAEIHPRYERAFSVASSGQALSEQAGSSRFVVWWHCRNVWTFLAQEVEALRSCAAQEGVEIISLGGTRKPSKGCPQIVN